MSLPSHRATSAQKHRRASHFALVKPNIVIGKTGVASLGHRLAPGASVYNGITIHVKGLERKLQRALDKTRMKADKKSGVVAEEHDHEDHTGHNHGPEGHNHA
jgi:ribosomal protein L32